MSEFTKEELHFISHYLYLMAGIQLMELKEGKSLITPGIPELYNRPLSEDEVYLVKYDFLYLTKLLKEKFEVDYPDYEEWIKKLDIDEKSILKRIEIDKQKNEETFNKETINKK